MDNRKLPRDLKTSDDYDRKLWGEILALHASIGNALKQNADPYSTAHLAEQLARRLGRLHALRQQVAAYNATVRKHAERQPHTGDPDYSRDHVE